jgi:hypothetical protein
MFTISEVERLNVVFADTQYWRDWLSGRERRLDAIKAYHGLIAGNFEMLTVAGQRLLFLLHGAFNRTEYRKPLAHKDIAALLKRRKVTDWDRRLLKELVERGFISSEKKAHTAQLDRYTGRLQGRGARMLYRMDKTVGCGLVFFRKFPDGNIPLCDLPESQRQPKPIAPSPEQVRAEREAQREAQIKADQEAQRKAEQAWRDTFEDTFAGQDVATRQAEIDQRQYQRREYRKRRGLE